MPFWVDKYAPKSISKLDYNFETVEAIKRIVDSGSFPHLLVYGPSGAGKNTRVHCILRLLYGSSVDKLHLETHNFLTPSKKKIQISTVSSNYHMEVNAADAGIYDKIVIQELIKTVASTGSLDRGSAKSRDFKVVVLHGVDHLTMDAQHALRRTMEKYVANCRLILIAESTSRLTPATRSRCLPIRIAAPMNEDIVRILQSIAHKEGLKMPTQVAEKIADASQRNLRRALLMAELAKQQDATFATAPLALTKSEWETYLQETARMIINEQNPKRVLDVRGRLYTLLTHCIPRDVILRGLVDGIFECCDSALKVKLANIAAEYDYRMQLGSKPIIHLEAFVVKFMACYKKHIEQNLMSVDC